MVDAGAGGRDGGRGGYGRGEGRERGAGGGGGGEGLRRRAVPPRGSGVEGGEARDVGKPVVVVDGERRVSAESGRIGAQPG